MEKLYNKYPPVKFADVLGQHILVWVSIRPAPNSFYHSLC
jgi:hypothetical protein